MAASHALQAALLFIYACSVFSEQITVLADVESLDLCTAIIVGYGYPCQEYTVPTKDGFLLGVQRIPFGRNGVKADDVPRKPVFLQHGLLQGGDTWVLNEPDQSLGFILADEGFDVWIGNLRGTSWSHGHMDLFTKDHEFWDWTWDELAGYDLPAMLELVYRTTSSRVYYVGHSQGTIMALAAFSGTKVAEFVAAAALLSPISYLDHITSKFCSNAARLYIDKLVKTMGFAEFNLRSELGVQLVDMVCTSSDVECGDFLTAITGPNCCFNSSRVPYYLQYEPHSTSLKNMQHLAQMIRKGTFSKYDYGWVGNLKHYYRLTPPTYDLSLIPKSFPMWMAYGGNDALADTIDLLRTINELQSKPKLVYVEDYGHLDFILSIRAKSDLYDNMISFFTSLSPPSLRADA